MKYEMAADEMAAEKHVAENCCEQISARKLLRKWLKKAKNKCMISPCFSKRAYQIQSQNLSKVPVAPGPRRKMKAIHRQYGSKGTDMQNLNRTQNRKKIYIETGVLRGLWLVSQPFQDSKEVTNRPGIITKSCWCWANSMGLVELCKLL